MSRGRGRGGNGHSVKRKPNTPVGGAYKDQRRGLNSDEMDYDDEEEEWTEVSYNRRSPQRQQRNQPQTDQQNQQVRSEQQQHQQHQQQQPSNANPDANQTIDNSQGRPSFASVAAQQASSSLQNRRNSTASANFNQKKILERKFVTPAPVGAMRDEITIEIQTINGNPFRGTLTFHEALEGIFLRCLELDRCLLHGIRFRFSKCPIIKYKLKEQINIDDLQRVEFFEFYRNYTVKGEQRHDTFGCKINGIRSSTYHETIAESDPDPNIRWVKVEWAEYAVQEKQILEWLDMYGEQASELSEDIHPNSDSDADPVGNGTFSIKMRLKKEIPQLLPMWGKRIRIYYRGVTKLCANCFGTHARKNCRSEKVSWIQYVLKFMETYPEIPPEFYGKWWKVVNEEFGELIEDKDTQARTGGEDGSQAVEEEPEVVEQTVRPQTQMGNKQNSLPSSRDIRTTTERLSRQENENLEDYLRIGMSVTEAREAFNKEVEMAELRQRIRDSKREESRGAIRNANRTTIGSSAGARGRGRGGLSFN